MRIINSKSPIVKLMFDISIELSIKTIKRLYFYKRYPKFFSTKSARKIHEIISYDF